MQSNRHYFRRTYAIALVVLVVGGCASSQRRVTTSPSASDSTAGSKIDIGKLLAGAQADAAYYRERARALGAGSLGEVARTDFAHFRRGALYVLVVADSDGVRSL